MNLSGHTCMGLYMGKIECYIIIGYKQRIALRKRIIFCHPFWGCTFQHDLIELITSVNPW